MVKIAKFCKFLTGTCQPLEKKYMHDMVTIDTIIFEIVGGGGVVKYISPKVTKKVY